MGCTGSVSSGSTEHRSACYTDNVSEHNGETNGPADLCSTSGTSETEVKRSLSTVQSTRGRSASSSTGVPKLVEPRRMTCVSSDEDGDFLSEGDFDFSSNNRASPQAAGVSPGASITQTQFNEPPLEFVFGDFSIDTKDVARQRVERLQRHRDDDRGGRSPGDGAAALGSRASYTPDQQSFQLSDFVLRDCDITAAGGGRQVPEPPYMGGNLSFACMSGNTSLSPGNNRTRLHVERRLAAWRVRTCVGSALRYKALVPLPDELQYVAVGVDDDTPTLRRAVSGEVLAYFTGHEDAVMGMCMARDGSNFASCDRSGIIGVWELAGMQESASRRRVRFMQQEGGANSMARTVCFTCCGAFVVCGFQNGTVTTWNAETAAHVMTEEHHAGMVVCSAASPTNPDVVATGGSDKTIVVANPRTGEATLTLRGHVNAIVSLAFLPSATVIVSSDDRDVRAWSTFDGSLTALLRLEDLLPSHLLPSMKNISVLSTATRVATTAAAADNGVFAERLAAALQGKHSVVAARRKVVAQIATRTAITNVCPLPGALGNRYLGVMTTTGHLLVACIDTGRLETAIPLRTMAFSIAGGRRAAFFISDVFGNMYRIAFRSSGAR